jgi:hypothetical protein
MNAGERLMKSPRKVKIKKDSPKNLPFRNLLGTPDGYFA